MPGLAAEPGSEAAIAPREKARAAREGLSLSDYLLRELQQIAARPTQAELVDRLSAREPVRTRESLAAMVRRERDAR